jgi:hypothetical protein
MTTGILHVVLPTALTDFVNGLLSAIGQTLANYIVKSDVPEPQEDSAALHVLCCFGFGGLLSKSHNPPLRKGFSGNF